MKKTMLVSLAVLAMLFTATSCKTVESQTEYYVDSALYATQGTGEFTDPGTPAPLPAHTIFRGWVLEGTETVNRDWQNQPVGYARYDAKLEGYINYYINGKLWITQLEDEYGNPGVPEKKDLPQGLVFDGWVALGEVEVNNDWRNVPSSRTFNAQLERDTVDSAIGGVDDKLTYKEERDIVILGPVWIEETYEIVNGEVKIGGKTYNDLLNEAIRKYPETDRVIDIITDYKNVELDTDFPSATAPSPRKITFQTAIYSGLAIDVK